MELFFYVEKNFFWKKNQIVFFCEKNFNCFIFVFKNSYFHISKQFCFQIPNNFVLSFKFLFHSKKKRFVLRFENCFLNNFPAEGRN